VKNTKQNSREQENQSIQKLRGAALRALSDSALKVVRGGDGTVNPGGDPIC
jgi:hypothetical protein